MTESASLSRRINAATIDSAVIVLAGFAVPQVLETAIPLGDQLPLVWFFGTLLLLEPGLIRTTGSTVGQALLGLRVLPTRPDRRPSFVRLTLRYWCKLVLGSLSLFYILFSHQRLAIHDRLFGTAVVRMPHGSAVPVLGALPTPEVDPNLPSAPRRFVAFFVWSIVAQFAIAVIEVAAHGAVYDSDRTHPLEEATFYLGSLIALVATAHLGAAGRLPGARRRAP